MEMTVNESQQVYVFENDQYVSYLGFDVVYNYCKELERRVHKFSLLKKGQTLAPIDPAAKGTAAQYQQYQDLLAIVGDRKTGTWFSYETPMVVRNVLDRYRRHGDRVRIFYGDTVTGRCWMEENDVVGTIGRSTGKMQIPLLIEEGESGGTGLLDSRIVRIIDANTRAELYRHKSYYLPEMEIRPVDASFVAKGYTHGVWVKESNGRLANHANFRSHGKAAQWVAFMAGECMEQPL